MDLLSDILQLCGLQRRLLDLHALSPGTALRFPCDRSLGLHAVTRGKVYLHAPNLDEPLALESGDLALMARGCHHLLALTPKPPAQVVDASLTGAIWPPPAEADAQVLSAAYQLWHAPLHPFLRGLPPWFVLKGGSLPHLSALPLTLGLLDRELNDRALGATSVAHGLLDAAFAYALREIAQREHPDPPGWRHAVADRQVRQALTLMHRDLAHGWTLDELAQRAGLSRSALAGRFRAALGDTPLSHLRTLRMQKAMQLLADTRQTLEQVAQAVGYQDAFGFSKVFKRTTGLSPRAFRELDAHDRGFPWRLQEA